MLSNKETKFYKNTVFVRNKVGGGGVAGWLAHRLANFMFQTKELHPFFSGESV